MTEAGKHGIAMLGLCLFLLLTVVGIFGLNLGFVKSYLRRKGAKG